MLQDEKTPLFSITALIPWIIASFFSFFQFFLQTSTGIISSQWVHDFQLDKVELSNLSAAFFYTYALMQIPAGVLFDRYQPRYILTIAASILAIGCALLAYTHSYSIAFFARLLMGVGSSFGFVGLLQISALSFPPNRFAIMLGLSEGLTMFAVTGGIMLLTWLVTNWSWRNSLYGCSAITFLLMIASFTCVLEQSSKHQPAFEKHFLSAKTVLLRLKIIFTHRQVILGSIYGFFMFAIVNAFTSLWGMSFLLNTYTFSHQIAGNMIAMIFIGIAIGGPLSGWLAKIIGQNRCILIVSAALATIIMSVIIFFPQIPQALLHILFFLIGLFCAVYVLCFAVIKESVSPSVRATALAATNMVIMVGAPILQLLIGGLLQSHFFNLAHNTATTYRFSLGILPIGMFIAFILAFWIKDPSASTEGF